MRAETGNAEIPQISILVGNAALFLPQELQRGADGAMTGFAYPEMLVKVVALHKAGDVDGAEDLFDAYLPMVRYEQQLGAGLAIRKEILHRRGVIGSAKVRAPGPTLTPRDHDDLTRLMNRLDQKLSEFE
jgi:4-hydroxy-tetrahydrodipicolinate synthase